MKALRILDEHSIEWLSNDPDGEFNVDGHEQSRLATAEEIAQAVGGDFFPSFECSPSDETGLEGKPRTGPRYDLTRIFFGKLDWSRKLLGKK